MAVGELWETATHAITAYTGLTPAAFFTVVALGGAVYHVVSGFFHPPQPPARNRAVELEAMEPLPPPVQLGEISEEELRAFDGSDPKKPLLMAIKAQIYDVTQSRMFYGPGGPYALFAGKDASRALAKMSFEQKDLTGDISGLGPFEVEALQDWEYKFMSKYVKVGTIKQSVPVTLDSSEATAETTTSGEAGKAATTEVGAETTTVEAEDVAPAEHKEAESKETTTAEPELTVEAKDVAPAEHKEVESKEEASARDEVNKG